MFLRALSPEAPGASVLPLALLGALGVSVLSVSAGAGEPTEDLAPPVRLVVMVSVDQMIPDQLDRLAPALKGGLGRIVREGMHYRDARLPYARTETGPGHVTFSTGCLPRSHGVVGNSFYDRQLARDVYCVEDVDAHAVRTIGEVNGTGRRSPLNLQRPTLAEILQSTNPLTRMVSISVKDRAAIGLAGRGKGLVLWWDKGGSGFQSCNFYGNALPSYVRDWNSGWQASYQGWVWNPIEERSEAEYEALGAAPDDRPGERPFGGMGVTFPYAFPAEASAKSMGGMAYQSPLGDQFVVEMARAALVEEELGLDDDVDVLCLSFSSCDTVGHANGPYSREVTDILLRLDRQLGVLLAELDERVGEGRWMLALTADHGVLPLPEYLESRGVAAKRVSSEERSAFGRALLAGLAERAGARVRFRDVAGGFRLDAKDMEALDLDPKAARAAAAEVVNELALTHSWIEAAYTREELLALDETAVGTQVLFRNAFHPDRTPDVTVVLGSHVLKGLQRGTSHGSPYDYDRHVPMLLMGPGFSAGVSSRPVGSQDIVPTLLGALGVDKGDLEFDGVDLLMGSQTRTQGDR